MSIFVSTPLSKIATPGILFFLTLISGVWLSRSGRPFSGLPFNVHKLIAVATIVVIGLNLYRLQQQLGTRSLVELLAAVATGFFFLSLVVTGGLLALDIARPVALRVHQIVPLLALSSTVAVVYLLVAART